MSIMLQRFCDSARGEQNVFDTKSGPSPRDLVLQPLFRLFVALLESTVVRLTIICFLVPFYVARQAVPIAIDAVWNGRDVLTRSGRDRLRCAADDHRQAEQELALQQYKDQYLFPSDRIVKGSKTIQGWPMEHLEVDVCGIKARVIRAVPRDWDEGDRSQRRKQVLLLHGNPSWSYIWRDIIPRLQAEGHEVYALDWLGHGASDKPVNPADISFEIHMRTLINVISHFRLRDFYIIAHDWGSCVALCTLPCLPKTFNCTGVFVLNGFFPPRPTDITIHYFLLYIIWFLCTGIFGPYLPESAVLRFMAPNITATVAAGYSLPYKSNWKISKASLNRFAHIVPGLPDWILKRRQTRFWRLIEGLIGPERFTNINAQSRLALRNIAVRSWWRDEPTVEVAKHDFRPSSTAPDRVGVLFGRDDPLLPGFRRVILDTVKVSQLVTGTKDGWLDGAGHYPMEQKPEEISRILNAFLDT